jgi:hypothetical protein
MEVLFSKAYQLTTSLFSALDKSGPHHNAWGLYGANDQLGTLNRLTDTIVTDAAKEIKTGTRISLNWPLVRTLG